MPPAAPLSPLIRVRRSMPVALQTSLAGRADPPMLPASDGGLRFFATCYLAGLIFFLVMLS